MNVKDYQTNSKPITIDELARMMADGFEEQKQYIDEKLTPINAKLSQVVTIDYLDKKMAEMRGDTII